MKILSFIGFRESGNTCILCVHFNNDPKLVEESYPGLTVMSSGFASVRDVDGFCNCRQVYLSGRDICEEFEARVMVALT
jgi:hypothetical protein